MTRIGLILALPALVAGLVVGCEENVNITTPGGDGGRIPNVTAACAERVRQLAGGAQPRSGDPDRPPIVVNIPRPDPTVRIDCGRATE